MKPVYYNEFDPYAAQWLRNLIAAGHLPEGDVDERSIVDVAADDLVGYRQCHFFAGIGGWSLAASLAGWPDNREIWTGSPPCQPFSVAGKQRGTDDERHLWPHLFRLLRARRPAVLMGEQVAAAVGKDWLDGVFADLEGIGYACGAVVVPACAVNAPHRRDRLWFVGHAKREGLEGLPRHDGAARGWTLADRPVTATSGGGDVEHAQGIGRREGRAEPELRGGRSTASGAGVSCGDVADSDSGRLEEQPERDGEPLKRGQPAPRGMDAVGSRACDGALADAECQRREMAVLAVRAGDPADREWKAGFTGVRGAWDGASWVIGHDGKARRVEPGIRLLVDRSPAVLDRLRAIEARSFQEVNEHANTKGNARQVLRMVRSHVQQEETGQEDATGMRLYLHEKALLLNYLLHLEAACDGASIRGGIKKTGYEAELRFLRSLREHRRDGRSSHRWKSDEQRQDEYSNSLQSLSFILARHAAAFGKEARQAHAASNRTGLLRGFGNAIVPQVAAEIIAGYLDVQPDYRAVE